MLDGFNLKDKPNKQKSKSTKIDLSDTVKSKEVSTEMDICIADFSKELNTNIDFLKSIMV